LFEAFGHPKRDGVKEKTAHLAPDDGSIKVWAARPYRALGKRLQPEGCISANFAPRWLTPVERPSLHSTLPTRK
jgi:hypothetical protein